MVVLPRLSCVDGANVVRRGAMFGALCIATVAAAVLALDVMGADYLTAAVAVPFVLRGLDILRGRRWSWSASSDGRAGGISRHACRAGGGHNSYPLVSTGICWYRWAPTDANCENNA